jgi:2TM domain-containing protein
VTTHDAVEDIMPPQTEEERRLYAIKRLKAKNDFKIHLTTYLAVNTLLVVIWALTNAGRSGAQGLFWPIIPMVGWGIAVVINAVAVYGRSPYTEERIEHEMRSLPR